MTDKELFKLHELKGRLQGREICLKSDIWATINLISKLETEVYRERFLGRLDSLEAWLHYNTDLLNEVSRIIKEAEND